MMNDKKILIILDSNSLLHRAYHALPHLTTKKGELVNAIYGFLLVLFKTIREFEPDYISACFDTPQPTFRHQTFKEYKAKRPPTPEDLSPQISKLKEVLKIFNIQTFEKEGFEADDIIATISKLAHQQQIAPKLETIVLSGDLDTLQLIDDYTKVYFLKKGVKETILYDKNRVQERYGVSAPQLLDFKALIGDPSDNIPGVSSIGEKTATRLIQQFNNLENLYQKLPSQEKLKTKLLEFQKQVFLNKTLVKLDKDVAIDFNLKECQRKEYNREKVIQLLKELEFQSLINRLPEIERKVEKKKNREKGPIKENLRLW